MKNIIKYILYKMKSLTNHLKESVKEKTIFHNNNDNNIKNTIDLIEKHDLDEILIQQLKPSTEDSVLNELILNINDSFQSLIERLEYLGYVDIHGFKIQKKNK